MKNLWSKNHPPRNPTIKALRKPTLKAQDKQSSRSSSLSSDSSLSSMEEVKKSVNRVPKLAIRTIASSPKVRSSGSVWTNFFTDRSRKLEKKYGLGSALGSRLGSGFVSSTSRSPIAERPPRTNRVSSPYNTNPLQQNLFFRAKNKRRRRQKIMKSMPRIQTDRVSFVK